MDILASVPSLARRHVLFEILSRMIGGNKSTVSPIRHIVDAPIGKRSWHGASIAFGPWRHIFCGVFSVSIAFTFGIFDEVFISMISMGMRNVLAVAKNMLLRSFFLFVACSLHAIAMMSPGVEPLSCEKKSRPLPPTFRSKPSPLPPTDREQPPHRSDDTVPTPSSSMHFPNIAEDVDMFKATAQGRALKSKLEARKVRPSSESSKPNAHSSDGSALRRIMHLATWFIIDSGCTYHCHPMADDLINAKPCSQHMIAADGSRHRITIIGDLPL